MLECEDFSDCLPGVYASVSSDTKHSNRGSLMVYVLTTDELFAWYVGSVKNGEWHVSRRLEIGEAEWRCLIIAAGRCGEINLRHAFGFFRSLEVLRFLDA